MDLFYVLTSLNNCATLQNVLIIHVKHKYAKSRPQAYTTAYFIKDNLIKSVGEPDMTI